MLVATAMKTSKTGKIQAQKVDKGVSFEEENCKFWTTTWPIIVVKSHSQVKQKVS